MFSPSKLPHPPACPQEVTALVLQQGAHSQIVNQNFSACPCGGNEAKLTNQPKGAKLEYRVKAINSSGESMPSNTISVVL
jgi:hypothetical protein